MAPQPCEVWVSVEHLQCGSSLGFCPVSHVTCCLLSQAPCTYLFLLLWAFPPHVLGSSYFWSMLTGSVASADQVQPLQDAMMPALCEHWPPQACALCLLTHQHWVQVLAQDSCLNVNGGVLQGDWSRFGWEGQGARSWGWL